MQQSNVERPSEDWLDAMDRLAEADLILRSALDDARAALTDLRHASPDPSSFTEIVEKDAFPSGKDVRYRVMSAVEEYERAMTNLRGTLVHGLVEQGMNFSEIGEQMGISRQMVTRLYRKTAPEARR